MSLRKAPFSTTALPVVSRAVEAVITIVGFPTDVEDVYFTPGNILDSAQPGAYLIDMTTTSPTLAEKIHAVGA